MSPSDGSAASRELSQRRERLRRAVEDGERLYRVRMHAPEGPTIADDNRIDGILTLDLVDALGLVDQLIRALSGLEGAYV